nr:MAG TPA: hypothetical protein [Caudoviricetes sp.]
MRLQTRAQRSRAERFPERQKSHSRRLRREAEVIACQRT